MTPDQTKVLKAFAQLCEEHGDDYYWCFSTIGAAAGLDRRRVRLAVRALARKGLARYAKGLTNDDGEMAGAGYAVTPAGNAAALLLGSSP